MAYELKLADIGEGIHEAEIIQWHVKEGDIVKEEQILVEIHTEKVNTEITSPVSGKIISLESQPGDIIKVGQVLVKIETGGAPLIEEKEVEEKVEEVDESLFKPDEALKLVKPKKVTTEKVIAAPAVRRRARELGVDLREVVGTGSAGRITQNDLDEFIKEKAAKPTVLAPTKAYEPGEEEIIPLRGIRRRISQTMRKSKDTAAHYSYFDEVDMSALDEIRRFAKPLAEEKGVKLTYLPLVIKCLIPALKQFPIMNSTLKDEEEEIVIKHYYNIGIAVDVPEGLIVPVIKNADQKNIWELSAEITDLANRAREGKLKLEDITGGTFTITSVGGIGGMMATPIIRWPEVAILGLMRAKMRPIALEKDGEYEIGIKKIMYISVTLDHRVVDGAIGARFGNTLIRYMENPSLLILAD